MKFKGLIRSLQGWLGKPIATPETDPNGFFASLASLPNPDPILRAMGKADQVYASIMSDAHVIGDIRSIRGEFRSHAYRVIVGDAEDPKSVAAYELCQAYLEATAPNHIADWLEVMWQMTSAILTGYRVHEPVWNVNTGDHPLLRGKVLPSELLDRANRRFNFDVNGRPLLVSMGNWDGVPIEAYQAIVSRHMPTSDQPYGQALLSACFWPWTFKTGGWRYFVKYCERHGLPWPIGRYPLGSTDKDINELAGALSSMLESGYAAIPQGNEVELLVPSGSGTDLPQEKLIDRCNREISKALTGQAMVAELSGVGARAASETALKRQSSINDADRDIAAESMHQLFAWITLFNFGSGVAAPRLEFYKQEAAGKERAETFDLARKMGARPSKKAMLEELRIPAAEDDADALLPETAAPQPPPVAPVGKPALTLLPKPKAAPEPKPADQQTANFAAIDWDAIEGWTFAKAAGMTEAEAIDLASAAYDAAVEDVLIKPVYEMLTQYERDGKSLDDFIADFADLVGGADDEAIREVIDRSLAYALLRGAATNAE